MPAAHVKMSIDYWKLRNLFYLVSAMEEQVSSFLRQAVLLFCCATSSCALTFSFNAAAQYKSLACVSWSCEAMKENFKTLLFGPVEQRFLICIICGWGRHLENLETWDIRLNLA